MNKSKLRIYFDNHQTLKIHISEKKPRIMPINVIRGIVYWYWNRKIYTNE